MALPTEVINRMLGLCNKCGADPCKCPNTNAAIRSPSLSSMTGSTSAAAHNTGGLVHQTMHGSTIVSGGPISGGSIPAISAVSIDDLVQRRAEPEPKPFVPSWEKDEPEEEEEMFNTSTFAKIAPVKSPELSNAVDVIRKTLADAVHKAVMDGNATLANDLMSMTTTELLDHLT